MNDICIICGEKLNTNKCACGYDETKNYFCYRTVSAISMRTFSNYKMRKNYDGKISKNDAQDILNRIMNIERNVLDHKHLELLLEAYKGDTVSQIKLGIDYYNGDGVERNYQEAYKWFKVAANSGSVEAIRRIGEMYNFGRGVNQSYEDAFEWYERAAKRGDGKAMNVIGDMYFFGIGVTKNSYLARVWYIEAAALGNTDAKGNLKKHFGITN